MCDPFINEEQAWADASSVKGTPQVDAALEGGIWRVYEASRKSQAGRRRWTFLSVFIHQGMAELYAGALAFSRPWPIEIRQSVGMLSIEAAAYALTTDDITRALYPTRLEAGEVAGWAIFRQFVNNLGQYDWHNDGLATPKQITSIVELIVAQRLEHGGLWRPPPTGFREAAGGI